MASPPVQELSQRFLANSLPASDAKKPLAVEFLRLCDKIIKAVAARLAPLIAGQTALVAQITDARRMESL